MGCCYSKQPAKTDGVQTNGPSSATQAMPAVEMVTLQSPVDTCDVEVAVKPPPRTEVDVRPPEPPPRPLPQPQSSAAVIVKAKFDYQQLHHDDLAFEKGDLMEIYGDSETSDWLLARHLKTGKRGYIPSNYVVEDDNKPESQEWWFDYDRREADKQLLLQGNPRGTFLIRASSDKSAYALSIRDQGPKEHDAIIKHYKIRKMDNGGCYIISKSTFDSVAALVDHYSRNADGLCHKLVKPCPKQPELIPFKDIEVDRQNIKILEKLGSGQFGDVHSAKFMNRIDVAVKTLKHGTMSEDAFLDEAKIMHTLRHRKLVQLMGVCTKEPMYIITELMVNGSLLGYMREDSGKTIGVPEMTDMVAQIADGMAYLEEKAFIHRDLRAANILVGENNVVKVADFGLARLTSTLLEENEACYVAQKDTKFPVKWTAPEAAYERKFSVKSDVWSFGILLYEIVTFGRTPYPGMSGHDVLEQLNTGYRMPQPFVSGFVCPNGFYTVMLECWDKSPEKRPTFDYLRDFFDDFAVAAEGQYRSYNDIPE